MTVNANLTLIQLISEQTLQNVLPILALQPGTVVAVLSQKTPRFEQAARNIEEAVALAASNGLIPSNPVFPPVEAIGAESPTIEQSRRLFEALLGRYSDAAVNYTGGTKDMSIGAWLAATAANAGAIYCDTPREFRSESPRPVVFPVTLPELARKLEVEIILAAQGFLRGRDWAIGGQSRQMERFGEAAFQLQRAHPTQTRALRTAIRQHGLGLKARRPNMEDVRRATGAPLPVADASIVRPFLEAAASADLLRPEGDKWFFNLAGQGSAKVRQRWLERVVTQLDGGAFEGYTQACLRRSQRFSRFIHGIRPAAGADAAEFGETDFLCFDPGLCSLVLITCKASPPSLEHLESVLARKEKLGGRFARGILCVQSAGQRQAPVLREQLRRLGLELAIGQEVETAFRCTAPAEAAPGAAWSQEWDAPSARQDAANPMPPASAADDTAPARVEALCAELDALCTEPHPAAPRK